jgi:hypothetical protein
MANGRVIAADSPDKILADPAVRIHTGLEA